MQLRMTFWDHVTVFFGLVAGMGLGLLYFQTILVNLVFVAIPVMSAMIPGLFLGIYDVLFREPVEKAHHRTLFAVFLFGILLGSGSMILVFVTGIVYLAAALAGSILVRCMTRRPRR